MLFNKNNAQSKTSEKWSLPKFWEGNGPLCRAVQMPLKAGSRISHCDLFNVSISTPWQHLPNSTHFLLVFNIIYQRVVLEIGVYSRLGCSCVSARILPPSWKMKSLRSVFAGCNLPIVDKRATNWRAKFYVSRTSLYINVPLVYGPVCHLLYTW